MANWIAGAIKHPGVEKARAKRHGISTHEQLVRDSHSNNPTLRRRGKLGLRLSAMAHRRKRTLADQ
jgi:hypothetical protein